MSNPKATSEYLSLKSDYEEESFLRKEAEQSLAVVTAERDDLKNKLDIAINYLKQGKARFAPSTTNSLVDEFIAAIDKAGKDTNNEISKTE